MQARAGCEQNVGQAQHITLSGHCSRQDVRWIQDLMHAAQRLNLLTWSSRLNQQLDRYVKPRKHEFNHR